MSQKTLKERYERRAAKRRDLLIERKVLLEIKNELIPEMTRVFNMMSKIQKAVGDGETSTFIEKLKINAKKFVMNDSFKDKMINWAKENPGKAGIGLGAASLAFGGVGLVAAAGVGAGAAAAAKSLKLAKDPLTKLVSFASNISSAYTALMKFIFSSLDDDILKDLKGDETILSVLEKSEAKSTSTSGGIDNTEEVKKSLKVAFSKKLKPLFSFSKINADTAFDEFMNIPIERLREISVSTKNFQTLMKKINEPPPPAKDTGAELSKVDEFVKTKVGSIPAGAKIEDEINKKYAEFGIADPTKFKAFLEELLKAGLGEGPPAKKP
jgi:hypothetical protein